MTGFWEWALAAWARPGVADACLELQDAHGQNPPLLLWVVWAVRSGRSPDVERGGRLAAAYDVAAGDALRQARRGLKAALPDLDDREREALRARVKAVELEGERTLMAALAALAPSGVAGEVRNLLAKAARAYGAPVDPAAFDPLLARI